LGQVSGTEALCIVVVVYKKGLWPRSGGVKVFGDDQISHWCTEEDPEVEEEGNLGGMLFYD
jgi:hypothetical protein